jgi:sulfur relay (sulfurtransferase) DsrC/TusE family protein
MNATKYPSPEFNSQAGSTKKKRTWYWGCGCAVVAAIIVMVAIGFGGLYIYKFFRGPVDIIKAQYQALDEKDYHKAYSYFTKNFQKKHSLDEYIELTKEHPEIFKLKRSSFHSINIKNDRAIIVAKVWDQNGATSFLSFNLLREKGMWKIDDFNLMEKEKKKGIAI